MTGTLERTTFSPKKIRDQKGVEKKDNYHNCVNKTLSCYKAICVNVSRSSGDYFSPEDRTAVITIFAKKKTSQFQYSCCAYVSTYTRLSKIIRTEE